MTPSMSSTNSSTLAPDAFFPTRTTTATPLPIASSTAAPTTTPSLTPTTQPSATSSPEPSFTLTEVSDKLKPGIYGAGGCDAFWIYIDYGYTSYGVQITWCVDHVEVTPDGSMIFVLTYKADYDFYQHITERFSLKSKDLYLTDNLNNRYDPSSISMDGLNSSNMVPGAIYYRTYTFPHANPGAFRFTIDDPAYKREIAKIVLTEPSITLEEVLFKYYPVVGSYHSDKWKTSQTEQGGFELTYTKYANCVISETQPGEPQGALINTIDIGTLKYDIYRTQMEKWSLREYVLVGGLDETVLATKPMLQVTIPYENTAECLDAVGTVLASLREPSP